MKRICLLTVLILSMTTAFAQRAYFSLMGKWQCKLLTTDTVGLGSTSFSVQLPGTLDTNRRGRPLTQTDETTHLSRRFSYVGKASYTKQIVIPDNWWHCNICLHIERTKPAEVFIDGQSVGASDHISTPQVYDLSSVLTPGKHLLTVVVDNSDQAVPPQIVSSSHAYSEDTQTNWNGMLGEIYIEKTGKNYISDIQVLPHADSHLVDVYIQTIGALKKGKPLRVILIPQGSNEGYLLTDRLLPKTKSASTQIHLSYQFDSLLNWSEFHPNVYRLRVVLDEDDVQEKMFGFCHFSTKGTQFTVNGTPTFLRGKHDACVFPLTGHVPMDVSAWRHYFQICKGYGINHVRFHSWCPPEACFVAADIEGVYLQPELPFWGEFKKDDKRLMSFLLSEGVNILKTYSNHPSFTMFALGNELWGDIPSMKKFVDAFRKIMPEMLFTFGSNYYLGYQGWKEGMDYFTTCRNGGEEWGRYNTHTRGSFSFCDAADGGLINHAYPNTQCDFTEGIAGCPVPIISHETAQFQSYPDYDEIKKYTGVLQPCNLEVFRKRLENAGMLDQAKAFHRASGAWALQLYKADIEMDLRTKGLGGFQLLDLQDYPGQGSAYVGMLDAFMESKGLTTPSEWRQWCSQVVPLALMPKYCWTNDETFQATVEIANFSESSLQGKTLHWQLAESSTDSILFQKKGEISISSDSIGLFSVGKVSVNLAEIKKATRLDLRINIEGTDFRNTYPVWIYPSKETDGIDNNYLIKVYKPSSKAVQKSAKTNKNRNRPLHRPLHFVEINDEMGKLLQDGSTILLMPDSSALQPSDSTAQFAPGLTVGGLFQTDYWNYRMFKTISENNKKPVSPGTLGLLMDPNHPLFCDFPTDEHTSWQWFPMVKASRPFILDNTSAKYLPIVQVIDNIERNHKLGLIFEFAVGKGRLLVCMSPLHQLQQYPEARQLLSSIGQYMQSERFCPTTQVSFTDLQQLFSTPVTEGKIAKLGNISPY